jgi:hypothetical protein
MAKKKSKKISQPRSRKKETKPEPEPRLVVFFELRDVAGIRYHSEHVDIERARMAARVLTTSSDVSQAWILRDLEIFRSVGG